MFPLRFHLFGPPRLERMGEKIKINLHKAQALLAYLAVTKRNYSRDALATLFWPEDDQSKARGNLRRALSRLNTTLGEGYLTTDQETAGLNLKAGLWLDVEQFQGRLAQCRTHGHAPDDVCPDCLPVLAEAAALYTDDFLAGFSLPDCPDFDEWQFFQREGLQQALASALDRLVRGNSDRGNYDSAILHARRRLTLDRLHEPAQRQLMLLYALTGQWTAAMRQYEECVGVLDEELGILPSEETKALYQDIIAKRLPPPKANRRESGVQESLASTSPPPVPPHNPLLQPTPFIGREEELARINRCLTDADCRLLTLIGPGGIGKTRLALEAASRSLSSDTSPGGVYFIPLAALNSADFLVSTIADRLNFIFQGGIDPKVQLFNYFGGQKQATLLVLDNFEQLADGADLLADLLQHAPMVKILTTSRERLNLRDEWVLDIQGLPFPLSAESGETLESYASVQLFLQTAARLNTVIALSDADKPFVARICQLVEGMPLGLELAAAWTRVLSCREIVNEIEKSLDFLTTSLRDVPARHRSLIAVFDHSWHLLSPEEQGVFRRLAVFRGGFSREAAEQVAGASLPLLATLADKSMLRRWESGRYGFHELLRQYAAGKLDEAGETGDGRSRHLTFYLSLAEEAEPRFRGAEQITWLDRLNTENGNLRAALAWSLEGGDTATGLRLVATLGQFWFMRSQQYDEALGWLERVLSAAGPAAQAEERAKACNWLGQFALYQGDDAKAKKAFEKSLVLYRRLEDQTGIADSLLHIGDIVSSQGDDIAARSLYAEARSKYEESLPGLRERGDDWTIARSLNLLGEIARTEEDYASARSFYEDSLAIRRKLSDTRGVAVSLHNLGHVAHHQGDFRQAAAYFKESLTLSQIVSDKGSVAGCLAGLAGLAGTLKQLERATRLFGAAEATVRDSVVRLEYPDQIVHDRNVAAARAQLDETTFATIWSEGSAMTLEQAIDYALATEVDQ